MPGFALQEASLLIARVEKRDPIPDQERIAAVRRGDEHAFEAMVNHHYAGLFDFAHAITRDPQAAEDVVQDVLLGIWLHRTDWRPAGTIAGYLFRAVRNRALNAIRDRHEGLPADDAAPVDPGPRPDADLEYEELLLQYGQAVRDMPERRQLIYRLSRLYGMSYAEVAEAAGVSINTVRTQLTAAYRHVRERLSKHGR